MLTSDGCRIRQQRLSSRLDAAGVDGALISHPRDIYYLTGVLPEGPMAYPSLLCLGPGIPSWLITGLGEEAAAAAVVDDAVTYPVTVLSTMNPDNHRRLASLVKDREALRRVGHQRESLPHVLAQAAEGREWVEIDEILQDLQLRKDPDELDCIRRAVNANLAGYARAEQVIVPGVTELQVMTECQAASQRYSRQVHFYNGDFQANNFGGLARDRAIEAGELYIIDAWTDVDGYWSDMSRTWIVGREPTDLQAGVYEHLAGVLKAVPEMARPGRDTMEFWRELDARIREHPHMAEAGLIHHGGHGIGLRAHEGPDLNRDRGGVFEVGNTFTCEPGFYSPELRRGIRLENNFHLGESGVETLSETRLTLIQDA